MADTYQGRQDEVSRQSASEAALQRFLDTAATGLVRITRDLRYQAANTAYARLVGVPIDQIVGHTMGEVVGENALAAIRPYLDRALAGEHIEYEVELSLPGSGSRWIHVICTPESDRSGHVIGWVSSVTDITERKRVENALRESERLQRLLAHVGELATTVADTDKLIAAIGERVAIEFGASRCGFGRVNLETGQITVIGDYHGGGLALSPVYSIGDYPEGLRNDLLSGRTVVMEDLSTDPRTARLYDTTYAPLGMRSHLSVPLHREGKWAGSFWISHRQPRQWTPAEAAAMRLIAERVWSVIDRAWAEDTLRASEERFRATFENAAVGIAHVSVDGRWLRVNDKLCEIVGYTREQLQGMTFQDITHPEDLDIDLELARQVLSGERLTYSLDKRYFRANGAIVWVRLTVSLLRKPDGTPAHFISIIEDITTRKRAEEALREADQRKDEFLALLAHELRNPLAPIRTSVGLMRARPSDDPVVKRCREVIDRQVTQMARLLDDLLDVSRLSRGQLTLQRKLVGLREILDAAVEASMPLIVQQRQELTVDAVDESIVLDADAARLTQVFGNLLNNAAKYSAPGSSIHVSLHQRGNLIEIVVRDRGMGIAPEMLERVFDLFTQAEAAQAHAPGGLGIGLSLARRLVEMHDGAIAAASRGLGYGSEFTVRLPIAQHARPAQTVPPAIQDVAFAQPLERRVLVVDDNAEAADMLAMLLTEVGCDVRTAYRGETAVLEAERFRPDLVLLDIGLPDTSGEEVCRRIRAYPWGTTVVIVAVTGWGQEHDRHRSALAGFDQHLVKPVDPDILVALTRDLRERANPPRASST
jgi:PAS domain S-box-containing protein